ncbi:hypothetical protein IWW40_003104 [Coemansia sp. RSA 1250]|nr:hypothetical protein IWW40_003104 [Coemansia sp. RSA 1250]
MDKQGEDSAASSIATSSSNAAVSTEATTVNAKTDEALSIAVSSSTENLLDTSVLSAAASSAAAKVSAASNAEDLEFNVDSLNLDSISGLAGLDFDVANLLKQVSGSATTSLPADAILKGTEFSPLGSSSTSNTPISAVAAIGNEAPTSSGDAAASAKTLTKKAPSSAQPGTSAALATQANVTAPLNTDVTPRQQAGSMKTGISPDTSPLHTAPSASRPPGQPTATSQSPRPSVARGPPAHARPARPLANPNVNQARPRPARPMGTPTQGRPLVGPNAAQGGPRPGTMRPAQMGARPRPPAGASPTTPRPGVRPVTRPRPLVRPTAPPGARSPVGNRPIMRPGVRPVARPPSRSPVTPARPAAPGAKISSPAVRPRPATAPSPLPSTLGSAPLPAPTSSSQGDDSTEPKAENSTPPQPEKTAETAFVSELELIQEEECLVTSPAQVAPPKGFGALYEVESTFRSLCHGIAPANAEWSSLNILAVSWPQLEVAAAGTQRLAQRDISDVSQMTAADNVRVIEEQRPPSSTIHLYHLHVQPPAAWNSDMEPTSIQPSLLPLCDLRMRQQWDEQVSQANMDRLVDVFTLGQTDQLHSAHPSASANDWPCDAISVSPLSGWHGGTSQAGMGERMRVASAPRCVWSADCRLLAVGDRAGRFEIFGVGDELNTWHSVYHVDFDCPVVACLWLANSRKYGISRRDAVSETAKDQPDVPPKSDSGWNVDPSIYVRRLPFFGPRNTQGQYALVVVTADGQLVLIYQRDEKWVRVVSSLQPSRTDLTSDTAESETGASETNIDSNKDSAPEASSSVHKDPASGNPNIPCGRITHGDMMLVSKKWIYLAVHRAGALPVNYVHESGAVPDDLKQDSGIVAPIVEVYRIQVEFESGYNPRLFAAPLVVQPVTLPLNLAAKQTSSTKDDLQIPRITHLKLITALNPEVRPVEKNILGENHYFPLLFVSLGRQKDSDVSTFMQVWKLEGTPHTQRSVLDLQRQPPPLKLSHMWTELRRGLLLSVIANRAERQQLRYLFAKPSDKDYRALMLTWADGRVEMLRNYQDAETLSSDRFDQCVPAARMPAEWVIGGVLSPHYTTYFQLAMRPRTVELGKQQGESQSEVQTQARPIADNQHERNKTKADAAVSCVWNQGHARFRLGWTPFFSDKPGEHMPTLGTVSAHVQAYSGDLLAVRILNKEDPTDLVAILANMAAHEENQPLPSDSENVLATPTSRTLAQALFRACTLLADALKISSLELDPLSATTPYVRRLLGAVMQVHFLAQHNIQAASLGLLLHVSSVVEARVAIVHRHVLQSVSSQSLFDMAKSFSDEWRQTFPSTAALVLWCIDLFAAIARDTYVYLHARAADRQGAMRLLHELDADGAAQEEAALRAFRGEAGAEAVDTCLLPGRIPNRLALLFHRPMLDAVRNLMTFVTQVEGDLLRRIQLLNNLPPSAASMPEYANMMRARELVVSTAQHLAHALEYLPVSLQRLKDFLVDIRDLYASDDECTTLSAQTLLVTSSTISGPFRKYLPQVSRSFSRFVLEPDVAASANGKPSLPSALVLHDTRWMAVVACRAGFPGLPDGTTVFETPWRVRMPVTVADPRLIDTDEDSLVPAAELAEWDREKSEFERALDEDNVLFDIDDPGFIFFDTSDTPATDMASAIPATTAFAAASAGVSAAPVRITTRVPDFSDVLSPYAANHAAITDADADSMFAMPLLFDTAFGSAMQASFGGGDAAQLPASAQSSTVSPCMTPRTSTFGAGGASTFSQILSARHPAGAQHFVPHYSNTSQQDGHGSNEQNSGWQFISTPRDPKLHIPTLLAQHAFSLAVLSRKQNGLDSKNDSEDDGMSYCIDWSRSQGMVIESPAISGPSSMAFGTLAAASSGTQPSSLVSSYCKTLGGGASTGGTIRGSDRIDVVQKTALPAGAAVKMCLRCGHATRRPLADRPASIGEHSSGDIEWIRRFDILCVCGGLWITL